MPRPKRDPKRWKPGRGDTRKTMSEAGWPRDVRFRKHTLRAKALHQLLWDTARGEMRQILGPQWKPETLADEIGESTPNEVIEALNELAGPNPVPLIAFLPDGRIEVLGVKSIHRALEAWKDEGGIETNRNESFPIETNRFNGSPTGTGPGTGETPVRSHKKYNSTPPACFDDGRTIGRKLADAIDLESKRIETNRNESNADVTGLDVTGLDRTGRREAVDSQPGGDCQRIAAATAGPATPTPTASLSDNPGESTANGKATAKLTAFSHEPDEIDDSPGVGGDGKSVHFPVVPRSKATASLSESSKESTTKAFHKPQVKALPQPKAKAPLKKETPTAREARSTWSPGATAMKETKPVNTHGHLGPGHETNAQRAERLKPKGTFEKRWKARKAARLAKVEDPPVRQVKLSPAAEKAWRNYEQSGSDLDGIGRLEL